MAVSQCEQRVRIKGLPWVASWPCFRLDANARQVAVELSIGVVVSELRNTMRAALMMMMTMRQGERSEQSASKDAQSNDKHGCLRFKKCCSEESVLAERATL